MYLCTDGGTPVPAGVGVSHTQQQPSGGNPCPISPTILAPSAPSITTSCSMRPGAAFMGRVYQQTGQRVWQTVNSYNTLQTIVLTTPGAWSMVSSAAAPCLRGGCSPACGAPRRDHGTCQHNKQTGMLVHVEMCALDDQVTAGTPAMCWGVCVVCHMDGVCYMER
jgi:hypothetical protein